MIFLLLAQCGCVQASPQAPAESGAAPAASHVLKPNIEALANGWIKRLQTGDPDRSQLSAQMNAHLTPALMRQVAPVLRKLGSLTGFSYIESQPYANLTGVYFASQPYAQYSSDKSSAQETGYWFLATFHSVRLNYVIGSAGNGKIDHLFFWPYQPQVHMQEGELLAALRTELQRDSAAGRFSGAVLVAKDGKSVFAQGYGLANRARNVPNTLQTRFRMGSMNKMFTAVAVLQLVQAGGLRLDDPVGKYLPDYPNKDVASKVTIQELLTHTGGTGDIFGPQFDAHRLALRTLGDYVKLYGNRALTFKPGSRFDYSNYGFILLGVIIERASGESYYDYLRQHVYGPAGMKSTGSEPENNVVSDRSIGYMHAGSKWRTNAGTLPYRGTSAGGGYSTVGDLLRFANALQADKLLNAHYTQLLTTGLVTMPGSLPDNPRRYAFGFGDQKINGERCFGHNGGAPGMNGDLNVCPGPGYVVAVLANVDPPAADLIAAFVLNRLPGR